MAFISSGNSAIRRALGKVRSAAGRLGGYGVFWLKALRQPTIDLTIHFRTASDNAFVLIAVHGAMKYGSATTAELYGNTSDPNAPPKPASAPVGPVIPFAVACAKAGWHTVQFRISGVGLAFEIARVDLSLFSS